MRTLHPCRHASEHEVAVAETGDGTGVRNHHQSVAEDIREQLHHVRLNMHAVTDQLDARAAVRERRANQSRRSVVERVHSVA